MPTYKPEWQLTDAQLIEALLLATGGEGGAPLQEVLLMADALEGDVLSLPEVEAALQKLLASGLVSIKKNKLSLTAAFLKAYEEITLEAGPEAEEKQLLALLQQHTLTSESMEAVQEQELKKYKLKNQYQQYLEQFG